jgi:hypothetical protein
MSSPSESSCFGGQVVSFLLHLPSTICSAFAVTKLGVFPLLRLPFSKSLCKRKPPSLASDAHRAATLVIWFDHARHPGSSALPSICGSLRHKVQNQVKGPLSFLRIPQPLGQILLSRRRILLRSWRRLFCRRFSRRLCIAGLGRGGILLPPLVGRTDVAGPGLQRASGWLT